MAALKRLAADLFAIALVAFLSTQSPQILPVHGADPKAESTPFEPTDHYGVREIEGWKVYLNKKFEQDEPELCAQTLMLLRHQLYQITRMVPRPAVEKVRKIALWVELAEPHHPCMCYHHDPG